MGQNFGASQMSRVREAVSLSARFCIIYGLATAVLLFAFARPLGALFNDDPMVIETAAAYFRIVPFTLGGFGVMMVALSSFNALARPMPAAVQSFTKMFVVYIPLAWMLSNNLGLTGVFWANAASHLLFGGAAFIP